MFSSLYNIRKVRSFSIVTSKDLHRKDIPVQERMKFESLQFVSPSRSRKKPMIYLVILAIVIYAIVYLNNSYTIDRVKVKIYKNDLEKVIK